MLHDTFKAKYRNGMVIAEDTVINNVTSDSRGRMGTSGSVPYNGVGSDVVWSADFKRNRYWHSASRQSLAFSVSNVRASKAYAKNGANWQEFADNALARVDGVGADIHGAFTNKIRNPRGEGGVVGTVGVTNKCLANNAAPAALVAMGTAAAFNSAVSNFSAGGGDGNTLFGIVDDLAQMQVDAETLAAAGDNTLKQFLANGVATGRVYACDNRTGAITARFIPSGITTNLNKHSGSTYARVVAGTARITLPNTLNAVATTSTSWSRLKTENTTPDGTSATLGLQVLAGGFGYFILYDLVEATSCPPVPTVVAGAAATGALPTNWGYGLGSPAVPVAFLGNGTEDGLPYSDIRFVGTSVGSGTAQLKFDNSTNAAASAGQAWGADAWVKKLNGTSPNIQMGVWGYNTFVPTETTSGVSAAVTTARSQFSAKKVFSVSTTNAAQGLIVPTFAAATAYDFTLRIYAPKLVQLAVIEGPELVTNGDFASATGWSFTGGGQTIGSGVLQFTPPTSGSTTRNLVSALVAGTIYKTSIQVSNYVAGGIRAFADYGGSGATYWDVGQTANGSYTNYFAATGTQIVYGIKDNAGGITNLTVDNVSLKLVTPGYMPAFPILPPVGVPGDSTRAADNVQAIQALRNDGLTNQPFAGWEAAGFDNGFTVLGVINYTHVGDGAARTAIEIRLDATHRVFFGTNTANSLQFYISNGATFATMQATEISGVTPFALTVKDGAYVMAIRGRTTATSAVTGSLSAGMTTMYLGSFAGGLPLNDVIQQLQITTPMTRAQAEAWVAAA